MGALDAMSKTVIWIYSAFATCSVAGIVGGVLILLAERVSRRTEPSDADVRRAAERYRQYSASVRPPWSATT